MELRRSLTAYGVATALLLAPSPSAGLLVAQSPTPPSDSAARTARWEEDLRTLVSELERRHPDLYAAVSKRAWGDEVERLRRRIAESDDGALTLGLTRLVARLGDSHTTVSANYQALGFHRLPIAPYLFDDGVFIRDADTSVVALIGTRIAAVNGHPIDTVLARLAAFVAFENDAQRKFALPTPLVVAEMLRAAGLADRVDSIALTVVGKDGQERVQRIASLRIGTAITWGLPSLINVDSLPLFRRNGNRAYWFEALPGDSAIYIAYNRAATDPAEPLDAFAERVVEAARAQHATRVIVDFRRNQGGNSGIFSALQRRLVALRTERPDVQLFGIVGRATFSSGLWNALAFQRSAGATLYGEPTGGKPNHFGEVRQLTLPHSQLVVNHSTRRWRLLPDEDPASLEPNVPVPNRSAEYFALRDPVLERILSANSR